MCPAIIFTLCHFSRCSQPDLSLEIESVVVAYDRRNLGQRLAIRLKDFLADSAQSRPICPGIVIANIRKTLVSQHSQEYVTDFAYQTGDVNGIL